MSPQHWQRLRTAPALDPDIATNRIRLPAPVRDVLEVGTDDIVELRAFHGVGWGRVHACPEEYADNGVVRFDHGKLRSLEIVPGAWVFVRPAEPTTAEHVTLSFPDVRGHRVTDAEVFRTLDGYTVLAGDTLHLEVKLDDYDTEANLAVAGLRLATVEMRRGRLDIVEAQVVETRPAGPVTVGSSTELGLAPGWG